MLRVENAVGKINHPTTRGHCAVAFFLFSLSRTTSRLSRRSPGGVANDSRREKYDILVTPTSPCASRAQKRVFPALRTERETETTKWAGSLPRLQPAGNL